MKGQGGEIPPAITMSDTEKRNRCVVAFSDEAQEKPNCVWTFFDNPAVGRKKYAQLTGYWSDEGEFVKVEKSPFILIPRFESFMKKIVPSNNKVYECEDDFEKDMFTKKL